jgi:hypothetical protein
LKQFGLDLYGPLATNDEWLKALLIYKKHPFSVFITALFFFKDLPMAAKRYVWISLNR